MAVVIRRRFFFHFSTSLLYTEKFVSQNLALKSFETKIKANKIQHSTSGNQVQQIPNENQVQQNGNEVQQNPRYTTNNGKLWTAAGEQVVLIVKGMIDREKGNGQSIAHTNNFGSVAVDGSGDAEFKKAISILAAELRESMPNTLWYATRGSIEAMPEGKLKKEVSEKIDTMSIFQFRKYFC